MAVIVTVWVAVIGACGGVSVGVVTVCVRHGGFLCCDL
ncbi:hypothetical protein BN940_15281 [Castellaniella defragrans 65Phen]|uniref:Uncharacterized protein n=1 Tax=Castellaniella defragrans (strain DSM 12143 / CCUG 39792 / 65Phen) TaxID=1437824 RepID=W8X9V8_CASD6|nr:hypothetical protein BN940_15281 [Castellaniella defragrans 65Phen]